MAPNRFYVGTSGYSCKEWGEAFYPKDLDAKDFLRYYSLVFPFVELDFSWYTMPKAAVLLHMARQTSPGFMFSMKLHKSLISEIAGDWQKPAAEFADAADALASEGKLGALLLQLPYDFTYTDQNRKHLGNLCSAFSAFPLAVEFRNTAWHQPSVFEELSRRSISFVLADGPGFDSLTPDKARLTSPTAYFRLQGHSDERWWNGDADGSQDYDYSSAELKKKAFCIDALSRKAGRAFIVFSNNAKGNSVRNARELAGFLRELVE
ncbi:MAG: DUF72 domain-containing protein [Spirochaetaceae bacterium]|nr:DUF72 domain-containing protein [Spirochaetaceae bacterium]